MSRQIDRCELQVQLTPGSEEWTAVTGPRRG